MPTKIIRALIFIFCLIAVTDATVYAQTDSTPGKIYFMRLPKREQESLLQLALNYCNVFIDSTFICRLDEKKYFVTSVPPGIHRFDMQVVRNKVNEKSEYISLTVEPGKSYYIQFYFKRYDNPRNDNYCKQLTEERANMMLPDLKEDKSCYKDTNRK